MTIPGNEFLELVRTSDVVDSGQLNRWLEQNPATDGVKLANRMVQDGLLTEWQAKYLLAGRHRLHLGAYELLHRVHRDQLGDRFLGRHKQLARHVDIQVLPASMSENERLCKAFFERVGETSRLDHPHLSHVYDIDQEGGRYFLVTEHVDGESLSDPDSGDITDIDLATHIQQAVEALRYAHENRVVHGDLNHHDLAVDREQGMKIKNLATSRMRLPEEDQFHAFQPDDDFRSLSRIALEVLSRLPSSDEPECRPSLRVVFSNIAKAPTQIRPEELVGELEKWIERWQAELQPEPPHTAAFLESISEGDLGSSSESQSTVSRSSQSSRKIQAADDDYGMDDDDDHEPADYGFLSNLALSNPFGLLASSFVLGLLLAGSLTYALMGRTTTRVEDEVAKQVDERVSPAASDKPLRNERASSRTSAPSTDEPATAPDGANHPAARDTNNIAPVVTPTEGSATNASSAESGASVDSADAIITSMAEEPPILSSSETSDAGSAVHGSDADSATIGQSTSTPPDDTPIATDDSSGRNENQNTEDRTETPFASLPSAVALPLLSDVEEIKIGDVYISNRYLMGAELHVYPEMAPPQVKVHFELVRDPDNKQRWIVNASRTAKDRSTAVAVFRREADEFYFQWLPEAQSHQNRSSGYLQNCLLKLFTPSESVWLKLRKPIHIDPLILTIKSEKSGRETIDRIERAEFKFGPDFDFLPAPESLLIEVLPVRIDDTQVMPNVIDIERGIPGRVLLKDDDTNPLVWVNIGVDLAKTKAVYADLLVSEAGQVRPLKSVDELKKMAQTWKDHEAVFTTQEQILKASTAPPGRGQEKRARLAELSKSLTSAKEGAIKYQDYSERVSKMLNDPYGIRVVARTGGHEIEIARTHANALNELASNPIIGVWEFVDNAQRTITFQADRKCVRKFRNSIDWTRTFEVIDEKTFMVNHEVYFLADDQTLLIGKDQREAKKKLE